MKTLVRIAAYGLILLVSVYLLTGEFTTVAEGPDPTTTTTTATLTGTQAATITPTPLPVPFTFASMGDAQGDAVNFYATADQIEDMDPELVLFNGDLEDDGVLASEIQPMTDALIKAKIFDRTFLIRGNHDNHVEGSAGLWESYFETLTSLKPLPEGVTHYTALDPSAYYLTYSFEYENSIFIELDDPGNVGALSQTELDFLEARLTEAENEGLTHAFIFFHGPLYCVESIHCACSEKADGHCTPDALVSVLNKHPIVSATFHGHEHILGWTHMDKARVAGLTGRFEQFLTSPSGGWTYNDYLYPDRVNYYVRNMDQAQGFAMVAVDGRTFTVSFYKTGSARPVWTREFTK